MVWPCWPGFGYHHIEKSAKNKLIFDAKNNFFKIFQVNQRVAKKNSVDEEFFELEGVEAGGTAGTTEVVDGSETKSPPISMSTGELYESFVRKRALVKYQSQNEVIKVMLQIHI